jgi:hypothetical protein
VRAGNVTTAITHARISQEAILSIRSVVDLPTCWFLCLIDPLVHYTALNFVCILQAARHLGAVRSLGPPRLHHRCRRRPNSDLQGDARNAHPPQHLVSMWIESSVGTMKATRAQVMHYITKRDSCKHTMSVSDVDGLPRRIRTASCSIKPH